MRHQHFVVAGLAIALTAVGARGAAAQDTIKVGLVMPMTGTVAAAGREAVDGAKLYMAQHGDAVAGKKIELIVKDDQSVPDNAKRLAQEMIVNDKVNFFGAGFTPSAMAMAPLATEGMRPCTPLKECERLMKYAGLFDEQPMPLIFMTCSGWTPISNMASTMRSEMPL